VGVAGIAVAVGIGLWLPGEIARHKREQQIELQLTSFSAASLDTPEQVEHVVANAASSERAVLFIHVDWAIMSPQHDRFAEFATDFQQAEPGNQVGFHFVDCTPVSQGYAPLKALPGWMDLQREAGGSLIHGWGEVVWMDEGRVLHVQKILDFPSSKELIAMTESLMPSPPVPTESQE